MRVEHLLWGKPTREWLASNFPLLTHEALTNVTTRAESPYTLPQLNEGMTTYRNLKQYAHRLYMACGAKRMRTHRI